MFDHKKLPPAPPPTVVTEKLSIEKQGDGEGKIKTDPEGLKLEKGDTTGAEETADFAVGTVVKLVVETKEGTTFVGFEGDPDCADSEVTMDASKHCLAHFKMDKPPVVEPPPVTPPVVEPPVTPPTTEPEPPVVIAPPPQPESGRGPSSDQPPVAESTCPTPRHLNIHLDEACDAEGKTIENFKVVYGGSLANAIITGMLTSDEGLVSNLTIEPTAVLEGGFVTNFIINNGLMKNFTFVGRQIKGGQLAGEIIIASKVSNEICDVILAPGTAIQGKVGNEFAVAKLCGKISGDPANPAKLENVTITAGTQLDNVIIGKGVILEEGVILGENVKFEDESQTPPTEETPACEINALGFNAKGEEVNDIQTCFQVTHDKETVKLSIQIAPDHIDQKADLLLVIKANPTEWYSLDQTKWKAWNGSLNSLKTKESFKTLPKTVELEMALSEFNELGTSLTLFVGYQLQDGTIVYNAGETL